MTEDDIRSYIEEGVYDAFFKPKMTHDERRLYNIRQEELRQKFRTDLALAHGVYQFAKEPSLFDLAWDYGHPGGYSEVMSYYADLVDLIKP